ncbi:Cc-nbs-lrr resistance protein [Dorcoceras hygrometricum]|uniref:Cc-nbs-lrr resistance protein n=1 Tax=Dorcoceras hygrometricum TaxID=472368 RepID=A0A2Z7AV73_9LAMI|nr:Cc-nbs-lrr resistance protein [Dorcoceras hygrometricum]
MELAFSSITLHLDDKVLREVASETTAAGIWLRLEQLYMTKTLQDRIYLKGKFFGYKMSEQKTVRDNLDEFNKLILDLETIGVKLEEEYKAIILLNSLPKSYATFVETLKYSRESLSLDDVQKALKSKESDTQVEKPESAVGDSLNMRSDKREPRPKHKSRSKSRNRVFKCFHCHKTGHVRKDCPERKNNQKSFRYKQKQP